MVDDARGGMAAHLEVKRQVFAQHQKSAPLEMRAPLAAFMGEPPPAPGWFQRAIAAEPERGVVATPRGRIETLSWGEVGRPGLLLAHGLTAHADWWSFICPMFADDYRVTAMSLAGMGDSDWREQYSFEGFAADAEAVCRATGLDAGGRKPVYIGHSFGGGNVFSVASRRPEQLHSAIIIDVGFSGPAKAPPAQEAGAPQDAPKKGTIKVYPSLVEALARFRLSPLQPVTHPYIVDYIARRSLKRVPLPDGSGEGWSWKFDPDMWAKFDRPPLDAFFASSPQVDVPIAHIRGEFSLLRSIPGLNDAYPANGLAIDIPDAHHHVMLDQPLALTAAIRSLLAAWRA